MLALVTFFGLNQSFAQISELPIDFTHSVISFSVGFSGGLTNIEGRFNEFSGKVGYKNPNDLTSLYADVTIKVASVNTGDDERNADLMEAGFFNVAEYPEITFKSKSVTRKGNAYVMTGTFTMLGKTVDLEVPFERIHPNPIAWAFGEPRIGLKGSLTLDRIEFGIPQRGWNNILPSLGSMSLSKDVVINLSIMGKGEGVSGEMMAAMGNGGVKAAIAKYKSLEKEWGSKENTYAFGGRTVVGLVLNLAGGGKADEAIEIGKFGVDLDPKSFLSFYGLAVAYQAKGDKANAIKNFEKTLELNPQFGRAKQALDALKK